MRIFSHRVGAPHFCSGFGKGQRPIEEGISDYCDSIVSGKSVVLTENSQAFSDFRDCLLREADRCLFMSASLMRWSHSLAAASSSYWLHTTLYYSTMFSAKAILAVQGGWYDGSYWMTEGTIDRPTGQQAELTSLKGKKSGPGGHRRFWNEYYGAVRTLAPWFPADVAFAFNPIHNDPLWLTHNRNEVNYHPVVAFKHMRDFRSQFNPTKYPNSFGGSLWEQFQVATATFRAAFMLARDCGLSSDVWPTRKLAISTDIFQDIGANLSSHFPTLESFVF